MTSISVEDWINWRDPSLWISLASITFNPVAWNIVAQNGMGLSPRRCRAESQSANLPEYRNRSLTRFFGGNAYVGCYFLAGAIFLFGMLRDTLWVAIIYSALLWNLLWNMKVP